MDTYTHNNEIRTVDYAGPDRRYGHERRVAMDPRYVARFDANGGDRRSGFTRRCNDI